MTVYDEGRAAAIRLLAPVGANPDAIGQIITLTYTYAGEYDPAAGQAETLTYVQEGSGVEVAIKAEKVNGTSILTGDSVLKLSPVRTDGQDLVLPPDGAISTTVTLADGTTKTVVLVDKKAPAGLLLAVEMQVRGAG